MAAPYGDESVGEARRVRLLLRASSAYSAAASHDPLKRAAIETLKSQGHHVGVCMWVPVCKLVVTPCQEDNVCVV